MLDEHVISPEEAAELQLLQAQQKVRDAERELAEKITHADTVRDKCAEVRGKLDAALHDVYSADAARDAAQRQVLRARSDLQGLRDALKPPVEYADVSRATLTSREINRLLQGAYRPAHSSEFEAQQLLAGERIAGLSYDALWRLGRHLDARGDDAADRRRDMLERIQHLPVRDGAAFTHG